MIDPGTIAKIIDTANIYEVINEFVALKKRGANYIGLCPFHDEKTPSFTVSPSKQIFKCFGCGQAGNVVKFLMEHEHISYVEALKYLAKKYGIEIEEREMTPVEKEKHDEYESLLIVASFAQKYFSKILTKHPEGRAVGLSYLIKRGLRENVIEKFQLGFCLDKKDDFTQEALKKGYRLDYLVKTGLTIQKDNWTADRFKGRVIFPIHNLAGRVVGFTGRTLLTDKKTAKYVNSPESPIYHKSDILYGLYFAKDKIRKTDKCYLVEGNTDVISLYQSGIENVVASSGTALTKTQIKLIKRFTDNITIIFDNDEAGIKAALKGIDLVLEEGLNVRTILLPEGEDPDSFANKTEYEKLVNYLDTNEKDFISFKLDLMLKEAHNDPVKKANLITDILRTISMIPDTIKRSVYLKECSSKLDVDERVLYSQLRKIIAAKNKITPVVKTHQEVINEKPVTPQIPAFIDEVYCEPQEKEIINYLLNHGDKIVEFENEGKKYKIKVCDFIISEILNDELEFKNLVYKKVFEEYKKLVENGKDVDIKHFVYHEDSEISKLVADIILPKYEVHRIWKKSNPGYDAENRLNNNLGSMVSNAIIAFKIKILEIAEKENIKELHKLETEEDIFELLKRKKAIEEIRKTLSYKLNIVSKPK
ncbi:MAG: DNA primase [Marinilabiliales bacterium]